MTNSALIYPMDKYWYTVHFNIKNKNPKKWTILLYSPGDSNISYLHLAMIKELQRLGSNNNVNIVIQSDYNKYEQNNVWYDNTHLAINNETNFFSEDISKLLLQIDS